MLIELLYPVMPGFAVLFILLNMLQLHFIVNKLARPAPKRACFTDRKRDAAAPHNGADSAPTASSEPLADGIHNDTPGAPGPALDPRKPTALGGVKDKIFAWLAEAGFILKKLAYVLALFAATAMLFAFVFTLPGARTTPIAPLDLTAARMLFSFLAVAKLYYTSSFLTHVWLAMVLFLIQALLKYRMDRQVYGNCVCYPVDYQMPQVLESATLALGLLSFLVGIASPQMLGQIR